MKKIVFNSLLLFFSWHVVADDRTYFLDSQTGEMQKYREDQTALNLQFFARNTDNYLYASEGEDSSTIFEFAPSVKSQYHNDTQMLQLGIWSRLRKVQDYSEDDTTDVHGLLKYHHKFSDRQSLVFSGAYFNHHLDRGVGLSKGVGEQLVERDNRQSYFVNVAHQLGNENSNAVLISTLGHRKLEYKNRPEATQGLNLSATYLLLDFQYSLSGKTYLLSKFAFENLSHDVNIQQDRTVSSALFGIKWHKTSYTHLDVSLGMLSLDFDDGIFDDKIDFKWDASLRWSPLEQIEINAFSIRSVDENRQIDNSYLIRDKYGLNFTYRYSDRLEVSWQNSFDKLEYYFETGNETEDGLVSDFSVYYDISDKIILSLSYLYQDLDAVEQPVSYERNTVSLGVSFAI